MFDNGLEIPDCVSTTQYNPNFDLEDCCPFKKNEFVGAKIFYKDVNKNLYTRRVEDEDRVLDKEVSLNRPMKEIMEQLKARINNIQEVKKLLLDFRKLGSKLEEKNARIAEFLYGKEDANTSTDIERCMIMKLSPVKQSTDSSLLENFLAKDDTKLSIRRKKHRQNHTPKRKAIAKYKKKFDELGKNNFKKSNLSNCFYIYYF